MAGGIDPADQAAHAGAGDVVHGNVVLFHPGNDPTCARPERSAALEGQPECRDASWQGQAAAQGSWRRTNRNQSGKKAGREAKKFCRCL